MYAKRVQIHNYGPIGNLDIAFPLEGDIPKPVLLVGENGSGKSILLSHLVNGLMSAQSAAYPETPEVETGKVYKLRDGKYIKPRHEYYFARVDFEDGLFVTELMAQWEKQQYSDIPDGLAEGDAADAWNRMQPNKYDHFTSNMREANGRGELNRIFSSNCVLYFPPNRFEEPAWLNQENLNAKAQYMDLKHLQGFTDRKIINYAPLYDNQNWLFEVIYDRAAFEIQTHQTMSTAENSILVIRETLGYSGQSTSTYSTALDIVQTILQTPNASFGIGRRHNRVVSVESESGQLVPNIFQLSSGETALLNLFLSILRDYDATGTSFNSAADIRGIVVVDEIDLHLHATHQHEVLPALIRIFPNVQFVVTTHSPLFVLGMNKLLGDDGFAIYRMPHGQQISPEEFSEFGDAYQAFAETVRHSRDIQTAIQQAQKPVAFVEGVTDEKYIKKAAELLDKEAVLDQVAIRDGGGADNMRKAWNGFRSPLTDIVPQDVLFLFDCDTNRESTNKGKLYQRTTPINENNPVEKGIENLFAKQTLEKAIAARSAFIDIHYERTKLVRGNLTSVPEEWTVNDAEKMNLCNWLCENGSEEDFRGFDVVFVLLEELLEEDNEQAETNVETGN